jgi:adenylate cyclase
MLARILDVSFMRPPPDLPPEEERLFVVRTAAPLVGAFLHLVQLFVFFAIGLPRLALLSVGSVIVFLVAFRLVRAGWPRLAMFIAYGEIAAHAAALTLILGIAAGYMSYYFALVGAPFLVFRRAEWREQLVLVGFAFFAAPLLAYFLQRAAPAALVPASTIDGLALMNMLGALGGLVIMILYFAAATDRAEKAMTEASERSERLLLNVLPASIAARLKDETTTIADSFPAVTVLFADIVGFTTFAAQVPSTHLVDTLNDVFSRFDRLADAHGLEKIKTIGDAYMVVGGLPEPRRDHVEAVARMAIDMRDALRAHAEETGRPLEARIGMHTGPAVAGVIGVRKFAYDLWGETVNTASRMESHGLPGRIHVTDAVREALASSFHFEPRGVIAVKGIGQMQTWFLDTQGGEA